MTISSVLVPTPLCPLHPDLLSPRPLLFPGPRLGDEPTALDPTSPPGRSQDWIRLIGLQATIPLAVPNEISHEPLSAPAIRQLGSLLATEGRRHSFPLLFHFFFFLSQNHKRQETWQLARRTTKLQMQFREAEAVRSTVGGACTCDLGVALALAFGPRGAAMKTTALVSADMGQWMARVWGWTSAFPSKKEVKEG